MRKKKRKQTEKEEGFKPFFKGCAVVPLTGDDDDMLRIRYYDDWLNPRKHGRIISKPRRYQLTFYLKGINGERGYQTVKILDKEIFDELGGYIYEFGNELIAEMGDCVDLKQSHVSIKA